MKTDGPEARTLMKTLTVAMVIHQAEEGGYWASFPELPGCCTQGETLDELRANAQEAVSGDLAAMQEHGERMPEPVVTVEAVAAEIRQ